MDNNTTTTNDKNYVYAICKMSTETLDKINCGLADVTFLGLFKKETADEMLKLLK